MLSNKNSLKPYIIIILATISLYVWQLHLYPMINPDGVTYIEAAAAYLTGGIKAAIALNDQAKWPFYSIFIAEVHSLTGQSLLLSEQILDASLIVISACFFLYLVRVLSQHKHASFWAIVIWLTWHAYAKWWPTIVRDHGLVTALLLSFYCYYRFTVTRQLLWALAWSFCLVLAELFRIEAVLYLLLIPFSIFLLTQETFWRRIILWLKLNVLSLLAGACVVILFVNKTLTPDSLRFAYMWQEFTSLFSIMIHEFMTRYQVIQHSVFYRENDFSAYALLTSYAVVFIGYVITQVSLAALPPLFWTRQVFQKLNFQVLKHSFLAYMSLAFIIPLLFFIEHVFLNGRYLLPLGLFFLLFVASILPHVIDLLAGKKKIAFIVLMGILLAINLCANLYSFGHINQDEKIIGTWVKQHYSNDTIFTNSKLILFYASSSPDYKHGAVREMWLKGVEGARVHWLRQNNAWCQYNLLVFNVPEGFEAQQEKAFAWLQQQKAIGPIITRYKRVFNQGYVVVAPIFSKGCFAMVHDQSAKVSVKNS
ncbi:MAG: hypothetical protein V4496_01005 [Pseudomonadota bacterium]